MRHLDAGQAAARLIRRKAYRVVRDVGMRAVAIGWRGRLMSRRRADRIVKFLLKRGHDVRVQYFGVIVTPVSLRLFD